MDKLLRGRAYGELPLTPDTRSDHGTKAVRADGATANAFWKEAASFAEGTGTSLIDYAAKRMLTRLADLVVPGSGAVIDALDHLWEAAHAFEAVVEGSGEIGITAGQLDGIDFVIDFRVGGSDGNGLPVTAHLAPEGDSLFRGIEITPAHEHGKPAEEAIPPHRDHVLMIETDLSQLMLWRQPSDRSAVVRRRAEQRLVPQVRSTYGDDVELLEAWDSKTGTMVLMRLSASETSWCILTRDITQSRFNALSGFPRQVPRPPR